MANAAATAEETPWRWARVKQVIGGVATASREHELFTYASAIAFRALVSLVPLVLLALALLGAFGLESVWGEKLAPAIEDRVSKPVFEAIDYSVREVLWHQSAGIIVFASLLLLWDLSWAVRAITAALNEIHGVNDERPWQRRVPLTIALAVAVGLCVLASMLLITIVPRLGSDGLGQFAARAAAWLAAAALISVATGLLVRYAPAERPEPRWASLGSLLVVGTWIVASLLFVWWASSLADYKTAVGNLTVFLVLTAYVFVSSWIFLLGAQLDELLRKEQQGS